MGALKEILPILLSGSLMLIVVSLGLTTTGAGATYLFRRPGQLLRAILAIEVVVPLVAALLVATLPLAPMARLGILLMAVSPVPPLVPGKQLKLGGKAEYVHGLYVAVSLLAIILVPLALAVLSAVFPRDIQVSPAAIARTVLVSVLLPLGVGMAIRRLSPRFAERATPILSRLASLLLLLAFVPVLVLSWPAMRVLLGNGTALAITAVAGSGLLAGHLLGGPDPEGCSALAVASTTRHPGIAMLIGKADVPAQSIFPVVLLFMVVGILVEIPYLMWSTKRAAGRPAVVEG